MELRHIGDQGSPPPARHAVAVPAALSGQKFTDGRLHADPGWQSRSLARRSFRAVPALGRQIAAGREIVPWRRRLGGCRRDQRYRARRGTSSSASLALMGRRNCSPYHEADTASAAWMSTLRRPDAAPAMRRPTETSRRQMCSNTPSSCMRSIASPRDETPSLR